MLHNVRCYAPVVPLTLFALAISAGLDRTTLTVVIFLLTEAVAVALYIYWVRDVLRNGADPPRRRRTDRASPR